MIEDMKQEIVSFKSEIFQSIKDLNSELNEFKKEIFDKFEVLSDQIKVNIKKSIKERSNMMLQIDEIGQQQDTVIQFKNDIIKKTDQMKKSIVDIISMEEAKLAMDSQDEQDKNSVALFGLQNETS